MYQISKKIDWEKFEKEFGKYYAEKTGRLGLRIRFIGRTSLELLRNSMVKFNKTASIVHFNETETNGELIFQHLYYLKHAYNVSHEGVVDGYLNQPFRIQSNPLPYRFVY
ncbi:hypothetical protein LEP1GSC193_3080 [Leptospira alstonii serovar Pingchang str. 80-412]|uniref:Uncharacterized protein n=1 Tax=Leptospira alstonii serovar Pingchang str. 80-412 TaxID=1218564 RepID=T0G447_9LEPT|nr:hypothetical protein LEP1GSC193_3080 [Leptospira alstonii serovar Pingchang str. 80-412]